ncbi:MAG: hypothetical protein ACK4V6_08910, partial [Microthrixaceae bacterium]
MQQSRSTAVRARHTAPPVRRSSTARHIAAALAVVVIAATAAACVPPPPEPAVAINMTPAGNFFSMPWPSDTRRAPDGTLDLEGLPGVELLPGEQPSGLRSLLPGIVAEIGASVDGFGVNTAAYFTTPVGLSTDSFPTPSASTGPGSTIMLLDLDHPGERVPVIVDFQGTADRNRPDNLLTVLPYPGHPLRESTRYAVALLDGITMASGAPSLPAPLLAQLDQPWTPDTGFDEATWTTLRTQRDEIRSVLESTTDWDGGDLLAFAAYTTQDVDGDVQAVAAAIDSAPPPALQVTGQSVCFPESRAGGTETATIAGTVALTRWQEGSYPYHDDGGEIVVDGSGVAVPQGSFDAEFSAKVPCGEPPAGGWPLLAFIDGTGGTWQLGSSTLPFTYQGWVVVQISPLYGVDRDVTPSPLMVQLGITSPSDVSRATFYNFFNPDAARTNPIQQTAEHLQLLRAAAALQLDGATVGGPGTVTVNGARAVIAGQSQGAQTLPMVASVRPDLAGVLSSAGSGGLYHTLSHNTDNRQLLGSMTGDAEVLDELNPIVQVAQTMLEAGDGLNFDSSTNYLGYNGRDDLCVPFENSRYFAGATGLPINYRTSPVVSLYGDVGVDPATTSLPVQGNV